MTSSSEFLRNLSVHGTAIQVAPQDDFTCYKQDRVWILTLHEIEPSFRQVHIMYCKCTSSAL